MNNYEDVARWAQELINTKAPRRETLAAVELAERLAPAKDRTRWAVTLKALREGKDVRSKVEQEEAR